MIITLRSKIVSSALVSMVALNWTVLANEELDSTELRSAIEVEEIWEHLEELQEIADENDGNRASGTPGFDMSAAYVVDELMEAGYQVSVQPFDFPFFQELSEAELEQILPNYTVYPANDPTGFFTMQYSGSGDVTAAVTTVDPVIPPGADPNTSNSGCEPEDFDTFTPGSIALIQRGSCTFRAYRVVTHTHYR